MSVPGLLLLGMNGRQITADYNQIHLHEGTEAKRAKLEMFIAKRVGEALMKTYDQRQWGVEVDLDNGVAVITCPSLSLTKGYHLLLAKYNMHQLAAAAVRAGGEILERHGISRARVIDGSQFEDLPKTLRGDTLAPDAEPEPLQKRVL